jgi:hypothetical protein
MEGAAKVEIRLRGSVEPGEDFLQKEDRPLVIPFLPRLYGLRKFLFVVSGL